MNEAILGILAAIIGALAALAGSYLTSQQQAKLEEKRWLRQRDDEIDKELRLAVAELMRKMATAAQTISWFTWEADYRPDRITQETIEQYDAEMRSLFPQIDSALITVSAFSKETYQKLSPLALSIHNLDLNVSKETRKIIETPEEAVQGIASYKKEAFEYKKELTKSVANIIGEYVSTPPHI